jgi:hypothetical protein
MSTVLFIILCVVMRYTCIIYVVYTVRKTKEYSMCTVLCSVRHYTRKILTIYIPFAFFSGKFLRFFCLLFKKKKKINKMCTIGNTFFLNVSQ